MKRYLEFIKENIVIEEITIYSEKDFHKIKEGVKKIYTSSANLTYLPELPDSLTNLYCYDNKLKSLPKLPESLKVLNCKNNKLSFLPELPENLNVLNCRTNKLKSLPKLPESLKYLYCERNKLKSLPELPERLFRLECHTNPLDYPIPHKYYKNQEQRQGWLIYLNYELSSYEHQKKLINEHGIYVMKKYENHPELINDKIKEENPTYFLSVEYGF